MHKASGEYTMKLMKLKSILPERRLKQFYLISEFFNKIDVFFKVFVIRIMLFT